MEVDQEIVSFALAELNYGVHHMCILCIKVENFKQQVTVVPVSL